MKKFERWVMLIGIVIILAGSISAFEFDNVGKYDAANKVMTITNSFGLGSDIAKVKLLTPNPNHVIRGKDRQVMVFQIESFEDYTDAIKSMQIQNLKNNAYINKPYHYEYAVYGDVDVEDYKTTCNDVTKIGGCTSEVVGKHKENQIIRWDDLTAISVLKGNLTIALVTDVAPGDYYDGVPELFGIRINTWAAWDDALNNSLLGWWNFNESGTVLYDVYLGKYNMTNAATVSLNNTGLVENCLYYGAASSFTNRTKEPLNFPNKNMTLNFWINNTGGIANNDVLGTLEAGVNGWLFYFSGNKYSIYSNNGAVNIVSVGDVASGVWSMITINENDSGTQLFVNALMVGSSTGFITSGTAFFRIGSRPAGGTTYTGKVDEMGLWNRSLTAAELVQLNDSRMSFVSNTTPVGPDSPPVVTLNGPATDSRYSSSPTTVNLNCTATDDQGLLNASLIVNSLFNFTNSSIMLGAAYDNKTEIFKQNPYRDGFYSWNCTATDNATTAQTAVSLTRNFTVDSQAPNVTILNPLNGTIFVKFFDKSNISLNVSVTDNLFLDSCWYYNGTANNTITCKNNVTIQVGHGTNFTFGYFANDSLNNLRMNLTTFFVNFVNISLFYQSYIPESTTDAFTFNVTADTISQMNATLLYGDKNYSMTQMFLNATHASFYVNFTSPNVLVDTAIKFNISYYLNGINYNTSTYTQNVVGMIFRSCNETINITFINITFADEQTLTPINGSIDASTWNYWLENASLNETYIYVNTTVNNDNYSFCFSPPDKTLHKLVDLQYSMTGYPQRRWVDLGDLTNISTQKVLYLLGSSYGLYSIYIVQNQYGSPIQGVAVTAQRLISGAYYTVEQGTTDSAGSVTFWLNPNFDHRIMFVKAGYTSQTITVRPSSSTYTVTMSDSTSSTANFNSSLEGIWWHFAVNASTISLLPNTMYRFSLNVTANYSNIVSCKFDLLDNNASILGTVSGCNSTGGYIFQDLNTAGNSSIRMKIYLDLGSGYFILDSDQFWRTLNYTYPSRGTVLKFFTYSRDLSVWGGGDRGDFSRILLYFLILFCILAWVSYNTNYDFVTSGGVLLLLFPIVWISSLSGFLTIHYIMTPINIPLVGDVSAFMSKYIIAMFASLLTLGYWFNSMAARGG